jgi:hypothetical protein
MKKFYALTLACILCTPLLFAQTYHWIGPSTGAGGLWNDAANWTVSGGGSGFPNAATADVLFDGPALVNVNVATISVNTIKVTNSASVTLFTTAATTVSVSSTSAAAPAVQIDAGSTLLDSTNGNDPALDFVVKFLPNSRGLINGTWNFRSSDILADGPYYSLLGATGARVDINGKVYFGPNTHSPSFTIGESVLFLSSTAEYHLDCDGGAIPRGNYDPNALVRITGLRTAGTQFSGSKPLGRIILNCPNINTGTIINLAFQNAKIQGDFDIQNTNDQEVQIVGNGSNASTIKDTIMGNLNISGTSKVDVSRLSNSQNNIFLYINGNLNAGGTRFDLQRNNTGSNTPTTLVIGGNLNHTGGVFTTSTGNSDVGQDLYVVEMAGTAPQTISSVTGTIDNSIHEMTLRLNNSAGVTLLTPLSVGRLSFNSANHGILTTSTTNLLTINNTVASTLTVNSPSNAGYVNGPVRRLTASLTAYLFPVGKGGVYRGCEVIPTTFAAATYQAEYFNTPYPDLSVNQPLSGVSNLEYWNIGKIAGADPASIRLRLLGQVPGAAPNDLIVPAHYNGTDWDDVHRDDATGTRPGDATTGTVQSIDMATFSPFTLGWATRAALPIILVSFDAHKLAGDNALLSWEVTGNSTPDNFEVLRSADGKNFNSIGVVNASNSLTYSLTDNKLPSGTSYYKLKMTDRDGSVTYSKVIVVLNGSSKMMITSLAPTVVTSGMTRVNISSTVRGNLQLVVTDMHGRIVQQYRTSVVPGSQQVLLNVMPLASGTYQVTGYLDGERASTMRFIKQ